LKKEKIYIDANNDGFFDPTNELIFQGNTPASQQTTGSINVDCGLSTGLRRVRIATDLISPNGPCGINNYGTAFEIIVNIQDVPNPVADFNVQDTVFRGSYANMTNTSTGQNLGYTFQWDYDNDGNFDETATNGVHQYNATGTYTIKLQMDKTFCGTPKTSSQTKQIVVIDPPAVPASEFIANRNVTNQTLTVYLKDLSDNGANKWHWRITPETVNGTIAYAYVNGTDSTSQNP